MAKKGGVNKSAAIRDYLNENPGAKPKEIVAALKPKGVDVTPAFVSTIKTKASKKSGGKRKAGRGKPGPKPGGKTAARNSQKVDMDSLLQAKKLADQMGGVDKAQAALAALSKLVD